MSRKLIGTMALALSYDYLLDALLMVGFVGLVLVLLKKVQRVRVEWPIFVCGVIFVFSYLLCPKVLFGSSGADARFILPAALLLILSLKVSIQSDVRVLLLVFILLPSIRVGSIWRTWVSLNGRIAAEVERLKELPAGASVYPIFVLTADRQEGKVERSLVHIVHYATIHRYTVVPTLFAKAGQQPLLFRSTPQYLEPPHGQLEEWVQLSDNWMPYLANYDYVWGHDVEGELEELLEQRCTKIYASDGFSLWRVNHEGVF